MQIHEKIRRFLKVGEVLSAGEGAVAGDGELEGFGVCLREEKGELVDFESEKPVLRRGRR